MLAMAVSGSPEGTRPSDDAAAKAASGFQGLTITLLLVLGLLAFPVLPLNLLAARGLYRGSPWARNLALATTAVLLAVCLYFLLFIASNAGVLISLSPRGENRIRLMLLIALLSAVLLPMLVRWKTPRIPLLHARGRAGEAPMLVLVILSIVIPWFLYLHDSWTPPKADPEPQWFQDIGRSTEAIWIVVEKDPSPSRLAWARQRIGECPPESVAKAAANVWNSAREPLGRVRLCALLGDQPFTPEALVALSHARDDKAQEVRRAAISALRRQIQRETDTSKRLQCLPLVADLSRDLDREVRLAGYECLATLGPLARGKVAFLEEVGARGDEEAAAARRALSSINGE